MQFIPAEIIRKKRDSLDLNQTDIEDFLGSYLNGSVSDAQMSALLMSIFFNGLSTEETYFWTKKVVESGLILDWKGLSPVVDKHSTGGIGDKVSIPLAPLLASMGMVVPMMSGRGLGHTGGTIDKLESIPGLNLSLSPNEMRTQLESCGFTMISQTKDLAPLDKRLYALRDVTGTVESNPLIAGSIIGKKVAEGAKTLLLDVKFGSGAFMDSYEKAHSLAEVLIGTGEAFGVKTIALITDMNSPIGLKVGNALEIEESLDLLKGEGPEDLKELVVNQAAYLAFLSGTAPSLEEALALANQNLKNGKAFSKFEEMVKLQGGDFETIANGKLARSPLLFEYKASKDGYLEFESCRDVGLAALYAGASRMSKEDRIDYGAGIIFRKKRGEKVKNGDTLCLIFSQKNDAELVIRKSLSKAIKIFDKRPGERPLIKKVLGLK